MKKRNNDSRIDANHRFPHSSCRLEDSHSFRSAERANATTCDPKTSEYAFFKKLKKDVNLRFRSRPTQGDANLPRKPESSNYSRERTDDGRVGNKGFDSSSIIEDVPLPTFKTDPFLSPSDGVWNRSDPYSVSSMQKNSHGCGDTFKPQGSQYAHGDIFSRKRQKLRQCVADVLPDTEKLCLKGHDIVSILLSRLFPKSFEENKYENQNAGKAVDATGYDLLDSQDSDVQFKEYHQIPTTSRKLPDHESSSYFSNHLLSPMLLRSDKRITPHAEFPTSYSPKFQIPFSITEPEGKFVGVPTFCPKNDETIGFLYNEGINATTYGSLDPLESDVRFKEHHEMIPKTKLLEFESSSYIRDLLLSPIFLRSNETIVPHADIPVSHSPNFQPQYITEPQSEFGESDVRFKEHHEMIPKTKLLEFESSSYIRDLLLSPIFFRSDERIVPYADFPASHSSNFQPQYITEPKSEFGGISFRFNSDVSLGFLFNEQEHETFTSNHFKELGKRKRETIPLLLESDSDCWKDEISIPICDKYAKTDMVPALSTLGNGEEQMLRNMLGEYHCSPSSLLLDKPHDFTSILDSGLFRYQEFRFGKYEEKYEMDMNFNHNALPLPHNEHYFKLSEDCSYTDKTSRVQSSMFLSPYKHSIGRTVFDDDHPHPDTEAWLSSSLDFISGQRCLSLTSSHSDYICSNSSPFQLPQREIMPSHFLINDNYEPELDDGNHREVFYHFRESMIEIYNSSFLHMSIMERDNGSPLLMDGSDYEQGQTHEMLL